MSKAKELKRVQIDEIKQDIQAAQSIIVVDYKGITVEQDTELRTKFRKAGVKYRVLKNRLIKIAFNELGITDFDNHLEQTNAFAFGMADPISPAKVAEEAQKEKKLKLKCGRIGETFLDEAGVTALAKIPPKETLVAMFLGLLKEPVARFARVLNAIAEKQEK
jgi:large subunit ribosomal protein L10